MGIVSHITDKDSLSNEEVPIMRMKIMILSACFSKTVTPSSGLNRSSLVLRLWRRNSSLAVVLVVECGMDR